MKAWIVTPLLATLLALPLPGDRETPEWAEGWLYNARERTVETREAFREGRFPEAVEAAQTAHRLNPEDPRTQLNLGTSLLAAERTEEALAPLTQAAQRLEADLVDPELPPSQEHLDLTSTAHYNLGNARLRSDDLSGAVEAYEQALRRNPDHLDAKHNLEVALERLRQQQPDQPQPQGQEGGPGEEETPETPSAEGSGGGEQEDAPPQPQGADPADPGDEPQPPRPSGGPQEEESPAPPEESPRLPRFEEQPDMTAEEAAAILEAVESLEREQRRLEATERARSQARTEKDW